MLLEQKDLFVDPANMDEPDGVNISDCGSGRTKSHRVVTAEVDEGEIRALKESKTMTPKDLLEGHMNDEHNEVKPRFCSCCANMTPFVLMIALSVHAIFEGLALGLSVEFKDTLNIVIAIVIHKAAASCALGISLVKTFPEDF